MKSRLSLSKVWQFTCVITLLFSPVAKAQIQTNVPALKDVYAKDFTIGCLLSYRHVGFASDPVVPGQSSVVDANGGYLIKFHMNAMSPGNNMKPQYTVNVAASAAAFSAAAVGPQRDSVDIHPVIQFNADLIAQLNWAQRQGFTFRGHTLVWHNQTPVELFRSGYTAGGTRLTKTLMIQRMQNYLSEMVRVLHQTWPGLLSAIDVVNEAIDDNTGAVRTSGNEWYTTFGDSTYIMKAFELMRAATISYGETQMKLYYNDYNTSVAKKANGIVQLCTPIYQAGYLDGIGMQEHDALATPTAADWVTTYNKFYPICNEMSVTEIDVVCGTASPSAAILGQQANQYGQLFKLFVERSFKSGRGKIKNVSKDGLNDASTFVLNQSSSLWNSQDQCKPSFYAVANVGMSYNKLDSLLQVIAGLNQNNYEQGSWSALTSAVTAAQAAMAQTYSVFVSADTALGTARTNLQTAMVGLVTSVENDGLGQQPLMFELAQNYPNPFNPSTEIRFTLAVEGFASLKVYDINGRVVETLIARDLAAGTHTTSWNASSFPSGLYLYELRSGLLVLRKKMVLIR